MEINKKNNFNEIDKDTFKDIVKTCLSELVGCKIDKEQVINALSKIMPYPFLMEYCSFKVVKGIAANCKDCKGFVYYGDIYVSVDIEELKEGNNVEYILSNI